MVFIATIFIACEEKVDAPAKIKSSFEQKYPDTKVIEWEFDNEDKMWEAEFKMGKPELTAVFSENGDWVETEQEIKKKDLPQPVRATLQSEFAEYDIEETEFVETPEGKFYEIEVELEKKDSEIEIELLISPDGKVIKKEEEQDEEDKK